MSAAMLLFLKPGCPDCRALAAKIDLDAVPDLLIFHLESGRPDDQAEANFWNIREVPSLVLLTPEGELHRTLTDPKAIRTTLQRTLKASADCADYADTANSHEPTLSPSVKSARRTASGPEP